MNSVSIDRLVRAALLGFLCVSSASVFGQGNLTPPGAPAPTMRTLDQVEPRTIVAQPISPANLPFNITAEGSYYLTGNIVAPAGHTSVGINVDASNVTIDLNGFELVGVTGSGSGIFITGGRTNIAVRNGTIRNWGSNGIDGAGNQRVQAESLRVISNTSTGLFLDAGAVALKCTSYGNGGNGIIGKAHSLIRDCDTSANGIEGISVGAGSVVQGCVVNGNSSRGIDVLDGGTIDNCSVSASGINGVTFVTTANVDGILITKNCTVTATISNGNTGYGLNISASGVGNGAAISGSTFNLNTVGGIVAETGCAVTNCTIDGNGNSVSSQAVKANGGTLISGCNVSNNAGYGIYLAQNANRIVGNFVASNQNAGVAAPTTSGNVIDGNTVISNSGNGINAGGTGNLVVRNVAHSNTLGNFSISAGNANGQVLSPGTAFTNSDPTANISY